MKLIPNAGNDRVLDAALRALRPGYSLDVISSKLSLFAFAELAASLAGTVKTRLIVPSRGAESELLGDAEDRLARNRLVGRWLAKSCVSWLEGRVELRLSSADIPQGMIVVRDEGGQPLLAIVGSLALTSGGLGVTASGVLTLVQASETVEEAATYSRWFDAHWSRLAPPSAGSSKLLPALQALAAPWSPEAAYALTLHHVLGTRGQALDEDEVINADTGIRNTQVWKKLYKFQRDGVVGAIDKLNRFGGCILADSVGLGKTFEALAVIKYHELRNDRVLVLVPKRLRDNWTLYKANDRRNVLVQDRFNYDVLNHTDLSREGGDSGDVNLSTVNWGNYDLVVIDESHNFRNKKSPRVGRETRYDRLMRKIIREGVKTRVLMLSATPVNNRIADLRNQIAFATEGNDAALVDQGIASIDQTTRLAQKQFNNWLKLAPEERTPGLLVEMLGFDYFTLLDLLTIARSRKHVERYYGLGETGKFPDRLKPINIKSDVDSDGQFRPIAEINKEIRKLNLSCYAPLRYVLPGKKDAYEKKYGTEVKDGTGFFRQADREESLIHLLRVNVLKRMESAVPSFALTLERQLEAVTATLARIDSQTAEPVEIEIEDVDPDDPSFENLLVGRKVKVLLKDVDLIKWRHDLLEDRDRLAKLVIAAQLVGAARDAKLGALRTVIERKCRVPLNPGNRKVLVFTAFADTAKYLFEHLAPWAKSELGLETALVTGSGGNQTTLPKLDRDLGSILSAFSPRSKERPAEFAAQGDIDLLIATDCISEGQNLQDCDYLINYDIHWNPVRIIQRFGRIDRLGSTNTKIQLINFWPNMELEEYIGLERRVGGRMVLLDISATGEENLIEQDSASEMNDLEYRRTQLLKLQDAVIDLEDLSSGVSIADLTLTDFRIDLAEYRKRFPGALDDPPLGVSAVVSGEEAGVPPGVIFCLRGEREAASRGVDPGYPLAPHFLVHVGQDGSLLLPYPPAKRILDRLKRACAGRADVDETLVGRFDAATRGGEDMRRASELLATAVASVIGKAEERAVASLFSPGGTHALPAEFAGVGDFEVLAFVVVLPGAAT